MTPDIAVCLAILASAVLLFAWDRIPADVVALGVMLAVIATGLLPASRAFAGFSSDTVMMILGLLVMSAGLVHTGVMDTAGRAVFELAGQNTTIFLPVIMVAVALVSAFMSNTAATAIFLPLVLGYATRIGETPAKFLLPLAFASILSSSVTLVSTSTNLVVSDALTRSGQAPMGMFELAPVGIPIAVAGLVYMLVVGVRLITLRDGQEADAKIGERRYQADVLVPEGSPLIDRTLHEVNLSAESGLTTVKLVRDGEKIQGDQKLADLRLQAGDVLHVEGMREELLKIKDLKGIDFTADVRLAEPEQEEKAIVEGVLLPYSPLIGRSLRSLQFNERYGLQVLAIHRIGRVPETISAARLRMGDVLLLQGQAENVRAMERGNLLNIFGGVEAARLNRSHAPLAVAIFVAAIAAVSVNLLSLPVAAMGGAFAMLLTRCLSPEEAYRRVDWKALILIAALLSLGVAMEVSGAGRYLAQGLINLLGHTGHVGLLTSFFILTVVLTQPMSNQAAALVVLPIALQTGVALGVNPRTFAMMVAVAASCSYLTPLEPSCLMVYGPGKYRFADFLKVGLPLTVLIYGIAIVLVPMAWPL